ncbi:SDR family oxidoreductase [Nocardioides sp. HDW12B]|nr:SDR family oxidoreductase [Nocardioides sp. HDW12B]
MLGRAVLVSGGTAGLGLAVAREAVRQGADVVVTGRRRDVGEAAAESLRSASDRPQAHFVPCDVADTDDVQKAVAATVRLLGRVDGLVNAAGLTSRGTLLDTTPDLFDQHVAVNVRGPFFLMQALVRHLLERGAGGTVVNVVTMSAHGGQPYLAPYVASKAALAGLTRNVAHAHRWDRIRVNGLNIGWTDTDSEDAVQREFHDAGDDWRERAAETLPMGRLGQVDEIAAMVVFLLSERSGVVTGSVIDWDQNVPGAHD